MTAWRKRNQNVGKIVEYDPQSTAEAEQEEGVIGGMDGNWVELDMGMAGMELMVVGMGLEVGL